MKKNYSIFSILLILIFATTTSAITLNYLTQPIDEGPGGGFLYTLTYEKTEDTKYEAIFNIKTPGGTFTTYWYAGWFTFKLVRGDDAATIDVISYPTGTGPWTPIPPIENIYGGNNIGQGGRSGFYATSLKNEDGILPFPYDELIFLTTNTTTDYQFKFNFYTNLTVFEDEIPFQVGFYDGLTGGNKVISNRLSKKLTVPEPSMLLLVGLGLTAVGIGSRWMRRK